MLFLPRIVEDKIFSSDRRNSMPRPLSSCKHASIDISCSPSKNQSHTIDQIHTIMSKVAQDKETLQHMSLRLTTCGTLLLTHASDQSPDARLMSRKEVGFRKRTSPSWKQLTPKWSISLTTSLKPLTLRRSNDGAKSAHSHEISLVSRLPNAPSLTINTEARSFVEQIKPGASRPQYMTCSYHIKSHQLLLYKQQPSQIHNSTINTTIPNHQPNLKLS
jgi:hypothetical protein